MTAIGHDDRTRAILENLAKRHTHQVVKETLPEHVEARLAELEQTTAALTESLMEAAASHAVLVARIADLDNKLHAHRHESITERAA